MDETITNWDDFRLFLAIARGGGLASAAKTTGKSAPTLGRRMLSLERHLGKELFVRLPRGYDLTQDGAALLAQISEIEVDLLPLLENNPYLNQPVVKISAGTWVTHLVCNEVDRIIGKDRFKLRFIAADEKLDIAHREAVIGIRNQRPQGISLAGRKIASVNFAIFSTDENTKPLARVIGTTPSALWAKENIDNTNSIEVTSPRNALDLALAGSARVILPTFIANRYRELNQVSPIIKELTHDQWLVTHQEDRFEPEVRKVINRIYDVLKQASAQSH